VLSDGSLTAESFARAAHGAQEYGDQPYGAHLHAVVGVLRRFGHHHQVLTDAAWLHDTIEDTGTTEGDLRERFGDEVAAIVHAVTSEPGLNRSERHKLTYPKIAAIPDAITVKLADRIANVEASTRDNSSLLSMYRGECPGFRSALIDYGGDPMMWAHLDQLLGFKA
jgi:guanosine-3',5'-bis(diphosphate) 3'-pyrophosphohydrolase